MPSIKKALDVFDKVYLITLQYCPERKVRALKELTKVVSKNKVVVVNAVSGDLTTAPDYWKQGNGAWGCLRSHQRIMEDVLHDPNIKTFVIVEDDVVFAEDTNKRFPSVWKTLPPDWGQFYLGGQHLEDPIPLGLKHPVLSIAKNINRTHAIAYNRLHLQRIYRHIFHAPDYISSPGFHVDHQLGRAHEREDWPTYAPSWWFAGQGENKSNISGRQNTETWWHNPQYAPYLPFIVVRENQRVPLAIKKHLHFGNNLMPKTNQDKGLFTLRDFTGVVSFLDMIRREAFEMNKLPGLCFDKVKLDDLQAHYGKDKVIKLADADVPALANYPNNKLFII